MEGRRAVKAAVVVAAAAGSVGSDEGGGVGGGGDASGGGGDGDGRGRDNDGGDGGGGPLTGVTSPRDRPAPARYPWAPLGYVTVLSSNDEEDDGDGSMKR